MTNAAKKYFPKGFDGLDYNFGNFVAGPSNRVAYDALSEVAETWPDKTPEPLFLSGATGLGKTHLLVSLAHRLQERCKATKICWISSEKFMNGLLAATQCGDLQAFRAEYEQLDVLIFEAIQFIELKPDTQREALRAFTELRRLGKKVVIDSDNPATELMGLDDDLSAFLDSTWQIALEAPGLEERKAIARRKYQERANVEVDDDLIEFLAAKCSRSPRELEGAILRLEALCTLRDEQRNVEGARRMLSGVL